MEKYLYQDILTLTKSLCMIYINGTIESYNKCVRSFMKSALDENLKMQDELFLQMQQDSYYQISNIDSSVISNTLNKLLKDE